MDNNNFQIFDKYFNKKVFINEIKKSILISIEEITDLKTSKFVLKRIFKYQFCIVFNHL